MSRIKPFQALYYNIKKVKDFAQVLAPPYDVISDERQNYLHNLSPYNFTHIDLPAEKEGDTPENGKYTRAKKTFREWQDQKVLIKDDKPSVYFYKQDYKVVGQKHSRLGFISLLELQDEDSSKVHPHEKTHAHAVDDRFRLTESLNAGLSPIFVCYSDKQRKVEKIFNQKVVAKSPIVDITDENQVHHRVWRLDEEDLIDEIGQSIINQNLFIADGHHRYQMACQYRRRQVEKIGHPPTGKEPFNFVMTYFTNLDSKDLQIFPMHRIVRRMPIDFDALEEFFRIDRVKSKDEFMILLAKAGRHEHAFGLYSPEGMHLLRLKNKLLIEEFVQEGSIEYKSLDATILKTFVFDRLEVPSEDIIYTKDLNEVMSYVDEGRADAGFLMNPVKISQLKAIALNGERMPPKTTYFYPKLLSGLTVYKLD